MRAKLREALALHKAARTESKKHLGRAVHFARKTGPARIGRGPKKGV